MLNIAMRLPTVCNGGTRLLKVPKAGQHSARLVARQAPQVRTGVNDTRLDAPAGSVDRLLENFWEVCFTAGFLA
jgi:hypothetical protein